MSIHVNRHADLQREDIAALHRKLAEYYAKPPDSYYAIANQAAANYTRSSTPFHCDLVSRVEPGMSLLELGCGTAHLCPYIESRGAHYTGMDYSAELLADNRERFPHARFLSIQTDLREDFDFVASLYTLEHVADPPDYLERMWNFCRPGGLLAVICPDFVDGISLPPSFVYGRTARRLREKLGDFDLADAWAHFRDLRWNATRWQAQARAASPGAFWINLRPRILHGSEYSIDADAVHLPRLKDIVWWFEQRGATILETSQTMREVNPEVLQYNCYLLARKGAE